MRDIKFKARFDEDTNEWVYGGVLQQSIDDECVVMVIQEKNAWGDMEYMKVFPNSLCQYTGLKDKNGIEIYENDIVNKIELGGFKQTQPGIIAYSKDAKFVFIDRYGKEHDLLPVETLEFNHGATEEVKIEYEVIGNIFDKAE